MQDVVAPGPMQPYHLSHNTSPVNPANKSNSLLSNEQPSSITSKLSTQTLSPTPTLSVQSIGTNENLDGQDSDSASAPNDSHFWSKTPQRRHREGCKFKYKYSHPKQHFSTSPHLNFNCRSLLPKTDELRLHCDSEQLDVLCVVETCQTYVGDCEIAIPNYMVTRLDRDRHGVALHFMLNLLYPQRYCQKVQLVFIFCWQYKFFL